MDTFSEGVEIVTGILNTTYEETLTCDLSKLEHIICNIQTPQNKNTYKKNFNIIYLRCNNVRWE